MELALVTRMSP